MTTEQIATRLAELCRLGEFEAAQKELFAIDAVSIEPYETPAFAKEIKGLSAIIEKGNKFASMVEEMHISDISTPIIAGNSFAMVMSMDLTMKGKERMNMKELCVYDTKDGKIVSESFNM
jgi:hypothetical protein